MLSTWYDMTWASYQIRKIAGCACAGNAGNVSFRRRFQRKPLVSDPGMHHGTCVTHVPWCMSGSLTCGDGENVPGIPGACAPAILCIWQEAHGVYISLKTECYHGANFVVTGYTGLWVITTPVPPVTKNNITITTGVTSDDKFDIRSTLDFER